MGFGGVWVGERSVHSKSQLQISRWYVVHGTRYMIHGTWYKDGYMVHGPWCAAYGTWYMVHDGTWYMARVTNYMLRGGRVF